MVGVNSVGIDSLVEPCSLVGLEAPFSTHMLLQVRSCTVIKRQARVIHDSNRVFYC